MNNLEAVAKAISSLQTTSDLVIKQMQEIERKNKLLVQALIVMSYDSTESMCLVMEAIQKELSK